MKLSKPIYVTQPSLPSLDEYVEYLKDIWDSKWLTNDGKYHEQLEKELAEYLKVPYISLFSNGTLALIAALHNLRISGEVITTPYSFVATTHALWWNNIKPVFVDIEPDTCNLDPEKIEAAITPNTTAILPVHVYGNPCDNTRIQEIADLYGLKVIYDAAHAFGVKKNDSSIFNFGDLSMVSFHATKAYNTLEGGALICNDINLKKRIEYTRNFGYASETKVVVPGINAKMNEFQAAFGLLQLKVIDENILKRKNIVELYRKELKEVRGIRFLEDFNSVSHNYSYFPIFVEKDKYKKSRDELYFKLQENNIFGRRYFYPLISTFSTYKGLSSSKPSNLPVATKIANEVICLPIYPDLEIDIVNKIIEIIK